MNVTLSGTPHVSFRKLTVLLFAVLVSACKADGPAPAATVSTAGGAPGGDEWFTDVAAASGLDFVHFNGMSGEHYYPEIMAPGVALLDYDHDGDLDVYVVQGQMLGAGKDVRAAVFPPKGALEDRLFRNDLGVSPDGTLRFTDVTDRSGIRVQSYGMGVATGDFDNDGWADIYRTGLADSVLLHNNRDGTFTDATKTAGVDNPRGWSVSAAFVDFDRDGWLDLYVGNYLIYSVAADVPCLSVAGQRDYCPPNRYRAQPGRLYHNRRNGTFEDVTSQALLGGAYGPALGVSTADFNGDGWMDIYVATDGEPHLLWMNQRNGTFKETAQLAGVAVSGAGNAEAGMGVDAGDFDNDGDEDLFVTNWQNQMNTLYVNDGSGNFDDRKAASGLGRPSLAKTGFGAAWFDFDNDGWLDLLTVNGSVAIVEAQARAHDPFPLRMSNQLYRNLRDGHFEDVSDRAGPVFTLADVGRGAAFGDIDNDGDIDVVIGNAAGPLRLLRNNVGNRAHWIGLRLVAPRNLSTVSPVEPSTGQTVDGRDMLGARVEIVRAGQPTLFRRARADGSYASANDPRVLVGLGASAEAALVRVTWPGGAKEEWPHVDADRWTTLKEGTSRH